MKTIAVRVAHIPNMETGLHDVTLTSEKPTAADAIKAIGVCPKTFAPNGFEIRVNNEPAKLETPVKNQSLVILIRHPASE